MTSPLIGITTRRIPASALGAVPAGVADASLESAFADYSESVSGAGGVPVLIARSAPIPALVSRLDGLVLGGGEDVETHRYGTEPGPHATACDPARDAFELALIDEAVAERLPILAICRGVQILNVALGGTLVEHLFERDGFSHAHTDQHRSALRHGVTVQPGTTLAFAVAANLAQDGTMSVNSYHHQAVLVPGRGLRISAQADDGTIEAVEMSDCPVLGVQWHPEMHAGIDPIFLWFIDAVQHWTRSSP